MLHKQIGVEIYKGNINSLALVKDEFVMTTLSDTANGFGLKFPSSSSAYKVHCNEMFPACAVLTHMCISHIPGGTIFDDNKPGINANWTS